MEVPFGSHLFFNLFLHVPSRLPLDGPSTEVIRAYLIPVRHEHSFGVR